jgi:hypothetical protein
VDAGKERIDTVMRRRYATPGGVGVAVAVAAASTSVIVNLKRREANASYGVIVTPSWLTTFRVTAKAVDSFRVDFGTAAPAAAVIDYVVVRSE